MTDNPPPAPDWVMGDDGHWKPPPFDGGGQRLAEWCPSGAEVAATLGLSRTASAT